MYCSKYLPDVIKEQNAYKDGKLQKVNGLSHTLAILTEVFADHF